VPTAWPAKWPPGPPRRIDLRLSSRTSSGSRQGRCCSDCWESHEASPLLAPIRCLSWSHSGPVASWWGRGGGTWSQAVVSAASRPQCGVADSSEISAKALPWGDVPGRTWRMRCPTGHPRSETRVWTRRDSDHAPFLSYHRPRRYSVITAPRTRPRRGLARPTHPYANRILCMYTGTACILRPQTRRPRRRQRCGVVATRPW
jgi:hypothetical protein